MRLQTNPPTPLAPLAEFDCLEPDILPSSAAVRARGRSDRKFEAAGKRVTADQSAARCLEGRRAGKCSPEPWVERSEGAVHLVASSVVERVEVGRLRLLQEVFGGRSESSAR